MTCSLNSAQLRAKEDPGDLAPLIQAWRYGTQIVNYSGPVGYQNTQGPYFKFGKYRELSPEKIVVHYSNIKINDEKWP